jgi:hypothetical protein
VSTGNLGLFTDKERNSFVLRLTDANRVLVALDGIEKPEKSLRFILTLQEGILVYSNLLAWQRTETLSMDEAEKLQSVLDRLEAKLHFFGQDV